MARYTKAQFEADLEELNRKYAAAGIDRVYIAGYRYGYAAVDVATAEQNERYCVGNTVCSGGTKKEMIAEARADFIKHIK